MKTPCPHCSVHIDIDPETHAALQGQTHFQCPGCNSLVAVPPMSAPSPQAASPAPATILAQARRGLNRNLLILGSAALLVLGGLGFFLASRSGSNFNSEYKITNEIIHNSYFQNLIASGVTTMKDLEAMVIVRPYGNGFVGISADRLTLAKATNLADRTGSSVFNIETNRIPSNQTFPNWLETTFNGHAPFPLWVKKSDSFGIIDKNGFKSEEVPSRRFAGLYFWSGNPVVKTIELQNMPDLKTNVLFGNWTSDNDGLRVQGTPNGLLRIPVVPKGSYELDIEFTRTSGSTHVIVVLPLETNAVAAFVGANAGQLQNVDHHGFVMPELQGLVTNNLRCVLNIAVAIEGGGRVRIEGKIDGITCLKWSGFEASLSQNSYWQIRDPVTLGVGVHESSVVFHRIRLKMIDGSVTRVRTLFVEE